MKTIELTELQKALLWFKDMEYECYEENGGLYLVVGAGIYNEYCVEVSAREISKRAVSWDYFLENPIYGNMKTIELNIDLISEELYLLILEEFRKQHPNVGDLDNWVIKADTEE